MSRVLQFRHIIMMAKNKANEAISDVNLLFEVPNKESRKILPAGLWILASI